MRRFERQVNLNPLGIEVSKEYLYRMLGSHRGTPENQDTCLSPCAKELPNIREAISQTNLQCRCGSGDARSRGGGHISRHDFLSESHEIVRRIPEEDRDTGSR